MLWICLHLSHLPLEVFTRAQALAHEAPAFAVSSGTHPPRIVAANDRARAAGIQPSQLVSAALALDPAVVLRDRDPAAEAAALEAIATCVTRFTPMASLVRPDAIVAEIGSSLRLFGGLDDLLARIVQAVEALGYSPFVACAPNPTAARLLAYARDDRPLLESAAIMQRLAPLSLAHLGAEPNVVALLHSAGIRTFGEATALPREGLARRLGAALVDLIDRARGNVPDPQRPYIPPPRYRGRLELPAPAADTEALGFAVHRLVQELAAWLQGRGLGVLELALTLEHERYAAVRTGIPASEIELALAAPARDAAHLMGVLRERLGRIVLPAPAQSLVLASKATAVLPGRNLGLLPGDEVLAVVPLLDRLRSRLGEQAVVRVEARGDHRPECAWRERTPRHEAADHPGRAAPRDAVAELPSAPRPLWLHAEPRCLGRDAIAQPWVLRDGPERIESGWWDGADIRRDYYVAQTADGERLWIFRDSLLGEDAPWIVHGLFA